MEGQRLLVMGDNHGDTESLPLGAARPARPAPAIRRQPDDTRPAVNDQPWMWFLGSRYARCHRHAIERPPTPVTAETSIEKLRNPNRSGATNRKKKARSLTIA